jgi:hypothetical protein
MLKLEIFLAVILAIICIFYALNFLAPDIISVPWKEEFPIINEEK